MAPDLPMPPGQAPLRWQLEAQAALRQHLPTHPKSLVSVATGCGKGTLIASLMVLAARAGRRCLFLCHRDELIRDVMARAISIDPTLEAGIVKGAENQIGARAVFASVQTLRGKRLEGLAADFVWTDEAHHSTASTYQAIYSHVAANNPAWRHIGLTATPFRSAGDGRTSGLGAVFDACIFEYNLAEAIAEDVLCPIRGVADMPIWTGADDDRDAAEALDTPAHNRLVVAKHLEHGGGPGIVFAASVPHAVHLAEAFRDAGVRASAVWEYSKKAGKCPDRDESVKAALRGDLDVLVNVDLLAEGFDFRACAKVHIVRPTESLGLFAQMVGRGTRKHAGKLEGLILDYVGNAERHNLASPANLTIPGLRTRVFEDGDVVRHRRFAQLSEGIVGDATETDCLVEWRGTAPDRHPFTDLVLIRKGRSAEKEVLGAGVTGLREYAVTLIRGDVTIGFYKHDGTHTAATTGGLYHIRKEAPGAWDVWMVQMARGRGEERTADTCERVAGPLPDPEAGMRWSVGQMEARGLKAQTWAGNWQDNPATERQQGMLRRWGLRRTVEGISAGECSALINAAAANRIVADWLDPERAERREAARARYRKGA